MMKRFAFEEKEMARVLLLVSQEQAMPMPMPVAVRGDRALERVFVCKTCDRVFPSFQALGGHRTSHLRGRHGLELGVGVARAIKERKKREEKQHECHICGLGFEMGQALGGHMRRHREQEAATTAQAPPVLLQLFR